MHVRMFIRYDSLLAQRLSLFGALVYLKDWLFPSYRSRRRAGLSRRRGGSWAGGWCAGSWGADCGPGRDRACRPGVGCHSSKNNFIFLYICKCEKILFLFIMYRGPKCIGRPDIRRIFHGYSSARIYYYGRSTYHFGPSAFDFCFLALKKITSTLSILLMNEANISFTKIWKNIKRNVTLRHA